MAKTLSALERNILRAKGVSEADLKRLAEVGIKSKADFHTVGDATTLVELTAVSATVAERVMQWALTTALAPPSAELSGASVSSPPSHGANGAAAATPTQAAAMTPTQDVAIESVATEPILTCFWCSSSGQGRFCRRCGAEFVPTGELELALLLKREGILKQDISVKLKMLSPEDKEQLWGRVRRYQG
jgi:hypothetical protein